MDRLRAAGKAIDPESLTSILTQQSRGTQGKVDYGTQLFYVVLPRNDAIGFPAATGDAALRLDHRRTETTLRVVPTALISPPRPSRYAYVVGKARLLDAPN
ncbi:MAG: hypothetical protein LC650_04140 [Actinobacteria bacterium]|nr:hypothetical protein [Actinomycetota bacterium]